MEATVVKPSKSIVVETSRIAPTQKGTEVTRLLCASAYMDTAFRDRVITECVDNRHNAIGVCPGMDLSTVAKHCLIARRKLTPPAILHAVVLAVAISTTLAFSNGENMQAIAVLLGMVAVVVAGVVEYRRRMKIHSIVAGSFLKHRFQPEVAAGEVTENLSHLDDAQNGNVVVYSGFSPFVGSGLDVGGWSFALDLTKGAEDGLSRKAPQEVDIGELRQYVLDRVRELGLAKVEIDEKVYVNGCDIRDDLNLMTDPLARPRSEIDRGIVRSVTDQPSQRMRFYNCIRVYEWEGELILSIFVRLHKLSGNLFVESSYFLLTPPAEKYRGADSISTTVSATKRATYAIQSLFAAPFQLVLSPFVLLNRLSERIKQGRERENKKMLIRENPSYDYGAGTSVRGWVSSGSYRRYFQKLDKDMYLKMLEKTILDSITVHLERHDVDTSDLRQRQTTILNNGVMMSGGTLQADNLSVGEKAKSMMQKMMPQAKTHA